MSMPNPYSKYRQTQVQTASAEQLILMLYDGGIRFGLQAVELINTGNMNAAHKALVRMQDIISELMLSLNGDAGEISEQLHHLYDYLHRRAVEANLHKDVAIVEEVLRFLRELRSTWAEAMLLARQRLRVGVGDGGF